MKATLALILALLTAPVLLRAAESWESPDGRLTCFTRLAANLKGEELWVRAHMAEEAPQLLWSSESWIEASWSPDSKFVAVSDHYDGRGIALLIFGVRVDSKTKALSTALLFQTPVKDKPAKWQLLKWDTEKGRVMLGKTEGRKKTIVPALLSDRAIDQSVYTMDPRARQPNEDDATRRKN